ncbi:uncharacterized protein LOC129728064 [Wyeomyia smithii]|uniref:uncharacterized protein LOC129728064 n=1 Tax=Wyeomyia smithii TaxID=174621 RepID=UPI002467BC56|nr:uncharacterized protein LOC129728064 [Wyeomyia smithii]
MKHRLFVLFGCVLIASMITGHRHHHHHPDQGGYFQHQHHHHHHHGWPHHHDWHHRRHHGLHHSFLNFEVREPKGLEVSMIQKGPEDTFFGIELYVNQDPGEANALCDVCYNTTEIVNRKFMIEDPTVVIRKGDILRFYVLSGNDSDVVRHHLQQLWVTESIINKCNCGTEADHPDIDVRIVDSDNSDVQKPRLPGGTSTEASTEQSTEFDEIGKSHRNAVDSSEEMQFECDLDPATNLCRMPKVQRMVHRPRPFQREVQVLSGIINHMKLQGCTARLSSNKLLLKQAPLQVGAVNELMDFVKSLLSVDPELQVLGSEILRVMPAGPAIGRGVIFEMRDYVAKQKVLYHAKANNLKQVVDYDVAG